MQTIETTYIGPSNYRGSRIKATSTSGHSVTLSYDQPLNTEDNHIAAAKALCAKLQWHGGMTGGHTDRGMIWVFIDSAFNYSFRA